MFLRNRAVYDTIISEACSLPGQGVVSEIRDAGFRLHTEPYPTPMEGRTMREFLSRSFNPSTSSNARALFDIAVRIAEEARTCYPNWFKIEQASGLDRDAFMSAFEELCESGHVFDGFPSLLPSLFDRWPLPPMFGPLRGASGRPSACAWAKIRTNIFKRDDYTCRYCGKRGVRLECDHVVPVSRGGGHDDSNLVTACFSCNRSKRAKTVSEWSVA